MREAEKTPISSRLDNLAEAPAFRGSIDRVSGEWIEGWCISCGRPQASVELDVFLGPCRIGSVTTTDDRHDVSKALAFPVKAGFRFSMQNCLRSAVGEALDILSRATPADSATLLSIRLPGSDGPLPYTHGFKLSADDIERFSAVLEAKGARAFANQSIATRDALLAGMPPPRTEADDDVHPIAFYLPQFHPTPENDEWWGPGFTEWTNVAAAAPSFKGHDQPRLPADLGFYDLRVDDVHARQVDLARSHGIRGFCYYYYWFAGRTLLTSPIDRHVEKDYDLDFCLCWANENWSRRWDGSEHEVLMSQEHTEAEDVDFIHSVLPYFKSGRYIRIRGAPLLVVYRISLLSDPLRVIQQWKAAARKAGHPDLHVCMAETFGLTNPHDYGADSSCQFPPHGVVADECTSDVEDIAAGFTGKVYDYREVVANELRRPEPPHQRFRGAMPSWDNTSRRGKAANVFRNHSPELFEAWLSVLCADARRRLPPGERLVFINAWNEWGEGAFLEPDRRHGHAYLSAVGNALSLTNGLVGEALLPPGTDSEAFRRRALTTVATLVNANRQLLRCLREHEQPTAGASPFIAPPPAVIRRRVQRTNATLSVDIVNGHASPTTPITVSRQQHLQLAGWLRIPDMPLASTTPMFARLVPLEQSGDGSDYIATIYTREQRQDVAAAFAEESLNAWYGFRLLGTLDRVPDGSYQFGLLVASRSDPLSVLEFQSDTVLLIG